MNSTVDLTIKATSFHSMGVYGEMMIGNNAIEFYSDRNPEDYIQIPWTEVDSVAAEVLFGKIIPRFAIITKQSGNFPFSTRDNKLTLRTIQKYVPAERMVKSISFFGVIGHGLHRVWLVITGRGNQ